MAFNRETTKKKYTGNYYKINRNIAALVGFMEAGFFDIVCDYEDLMIRNQKIKIGDAFFIPTKALTKFSSGLTYKQHWRIFNVLQGKGLLKMETRGIPPKRYITIDWEMVDKIISAVPEEIELFLEEIE